MNENNYYEILKIVEKIRFNSIAYGMYGALGISEKRDVAYEKQDQASAELREYILYLIYQNN